MAFPGLTTPLLPCPFGRSGSEGGGILEKEDAQRKESLEGKQWGYCPQRRTWEYLHLSFPPPKPEESCLVLSRNPCKDRT